MSSVTAVGGTESLGTHWRAEPLNVPRGLELDIASREHGGSVEEAWGLR